MGGRKRQKAPKEGTISKLPSDIIVNILSRLPVKTIIICKNVCRAWRNALSDPSFPQIHLEKSPVSLMLCGFPTSTFYLIEFGKDLRRRKISKFNGGDRFLPSLVGSCNGLLCFLTSNLDAYYVWNPVRNECVTIPVPTMEAGHRLHFSISQSGFGYCPRTNLYKVITMVSGGVAWMKPSNQAMCKVFTLGTKAWRTIDEDVPVPHSGDSVCKMSFNGAVHWICSFKINGEKFPIRICGFRIEDEKWDPISLPLPLLEVPGLEFTDRRKEILLSWLQLGVLENCLALYDRSEYCLLDIWIMKNYGVRESWTKCWSIESLIPSEMHVFSLRPLKLTKDGDLLTFDDLNKALICFNPQKGMPCKQKLYGLSRRTKAIAYVASFISLKEVIKEES